MLVLLVLLHLSNDVGCNIFENKTYIRQPNPQAQTDVILSVPTESMSDCATICFNTETCYSFSLNSITGPCLCSKKMDGEYVDASVFPEAEACHGNAGYQYEPELDLCYKVKTTPLRDADQSRMACELEGGHLARVTNQRAQQFVVNLISATEYSSVPRFFIDGSDDETEDVWKFSDGSKIEWNDWKIGNSFSGPTFNCLSLWRYVSFRWTDLACTGYEGGCVCQIDV